MIVSVVIDDYFEAFWKVILTRTTELHLLLAYKDWSTGVSTTKGSDTSREEYPILFTFETVSKVVFGILIIGIAFLPRNKDEQSNDE
ncbi:hypothetical protein ACPUVO_06755 [Pseudocolwellia sp. HL-MZ19]|uniref:hypothetical protein n=1 Tax=unclassified Pseudocolwellia TaxID=2848178 RepID=UPI003CE7CA60